MPALLKTTLSAFLALRSGLGVMPAAVASDDLIALTGTVLERVSQKVDSLGFEGARLAIALMGGQGFIGAKLYWLCFPAYS